MIGHRCGDFFGGNGFAGEECLVDAQAVAFEEAEVGRYAVAGLEQDDVTGDEVGRVEGLLVSFAPHHGLGGKHGADRVEGLFRFALLDHANESVDHDDTENDTGVDPFIEKRGADRGGEKDVD